MPEDKVPVVGSVVRIWGAVLTAVEVSAISNWIVWGAEIVICIEINYSTVSIIRVIEV